MKPDPRQLATLVEKNFSIPTIPVVASEALRALNDPNTNASKIAKIIAQDHGLTARLLKLVNSALYRPSQEVRSIPQACMILGFRVLKSIIIAASAKVIYKEFGALEKHLWNHSVACAVAAHILAQAKKLASRDEAFVAGLMHDVGKVVMNNGSRKQFEKAVVMSQQDKLTTPDAELKVFGFSHTDVGAVLVRRWELSERLEHAVFFHHEPDLATTLAEESIDLVRVTHLANQLCHKLGLGGRKTEDLDPAAVETAAELGFEEEELPVIEKKIVETYEAEHGAFD